MSTTRESLLTQAYQATCRALDTGRPTELDDARVLCDFISASALHQIAHDLQKITRHIEGRKT